MGRRELTASSSMKEQSESDAVGDVGADGDGGRLRPVVEAEEAGRFERRGRGWPGAVRCHAWVNASDERDEHEESGGGVQQAQQASEPPAGRVEQCEGGGVAEGE